MIIFVYWLQDFYLQYQILQSIMKNFPLTTPLMIIFVYNIFTYQIWLPSSWLFSFIHYNTLTYQIWWSIIKKTSHDYSYHYYFHLFITRLLLTRFDILRGFIFILILLSFVFYILYFCFLWSSLFYIKKQI